MKIFMATELVGSITIRIINDDGSHIRLKGTRCDDFMPIYGCKLDPGEKERLKKFMENIPVQEHLDK